MRYGVGADGGFVAHVSIYGQNTLPAFTFRAYFQNSLSELTFRSRLQNSRLNLRLLADR